MSTGRKLLIGAICAAAVAAIPATALAVFPGNNGKIALVSGRDGGDLEADVYIIDGPGDTTVSPKVAAAVTGQHRHPNWSPDGERIVVAVRTGANNDLWIRNLVNGSGSNVTLSPTVLEDHPTFSPDGTMIAYESEVGDGAGITDILLAPVNNNGSLGTPTPLTDTSTLTESTPVWGPNGNRIYYARRAAAMGEYDVVFEKADNSSAVPTILPDAGSGADEWQPEISPDGQKVCFTHGPLFSANADILVANIDGSGDPFEFNANDTAMPVADYNCGWSPEGDTIAFTRGLTTTGNLYFGSSSGAGDPTAWGGNSAFFDGNVDWVRIPGNCDGKPATIAGTSGSDDISGTPGKDVIVTFEGKDRVRGKAGNDRICSGKANDTISGRTGKDRLIAGPGNDKLNGGPDRDKCNGGTGRDAASGCERETKIEQ